MLTRNLASGFWGNKKRLRGVSFECVGYRLPEIQRDKLKL